MSSKSRDILSQEEGIEIGSDSQEDAKGTSICEVAGSSLKRHVDVVSAGLPAETSSERMLVAIVELVSAKLALPEGVGEKREGVLAAG